MMDHIAFVGFGEAATAFVTGWADRRPARISVFDTKTDDQATRNVMLARYADQAVAGADGLAEALADAPVIFSVVTADRALHAARSAAPVLAPDALWLDCNSCAPETKRAAAQVIAAAGGRYVDVAVMAPVHPQKNHVPLLVSGPHAQAAVAVLTALDMRPVVAGDTVGQASSIKMLRSVMIKGMEALTAECFLAARRAGVDDAVIASLEASDPGVDWRRRGSYNLERMMIHGTRRAAEMREAAATVAALGLSARMAAATADWQDQIAATGASAVADDLAERADAVLQKL
jgi:3-hydroxyisobutyrate dehydrogenase-like beta-hydroxyacid dehydrogenase